MRTPPGRFKNQVQASRIRMPLPASFYAAPPSPWRGSAVTTSVVRAYQPATPPAALAGLPGPTGHFPGSFPGGPTPVPTTCHSCSSRHWHALSYPHPPCPPPHPSPPYPPPAIPALPDTEMHSPTHHHHPPPPTPPPPPAHPTPPTPTPPHPTPTPPLWTRAPNRHSSLSSSRSPSPQGRRSCSLSSRHQRFRSFSRDCISRPHAADQHLLRLRVDDGDQHPHDSPIPEQSTTVDDSQLSAEKVQKLFADLLDPPALSHYADPLPDSTPSNQLVPYDRTSSSTAPRVSNIEPLDTHGLFQNYQSFHRLSGDQDKEACTAAYHDLTNLMLSQTSEEASLINVSSSRPKPEGPYMSDLAATDELKKKQDKIHLQWPPLKNHNKVIQRTLSLYQHGPQPKSGTSDQWPPHPVRNPWDKDFVPKDFPTTHKIPSTMPKRWDIHASSPLMLRPPHSTAVTEVPDSEITKYPSWLEAFAARSSHTSSMSATSMVGVYNFLPKITRFLRASAAKNNIQNDITLVDDLIQRANCMALEAHLMAHDAGVTSTELFTHLHMLRRRTVLESPTVDLPQRDKDRLLVRSVGGNDLFGPDACKVHEWKRDTEEEKIKLISRVFDEYDQRDKAKKKPSSSESRPARSLSHRSPLDSFFFFFFYSQHKKRNKTRFLQRHPYNATWLAVRVFMFFHATLQHHIVSWWGHFPGQSGLVSWLPCYLLNFLDLGPGCIIYPAGTNRTDLHQKQTMVCKVHMVYHTQ